jgi:hypothetical protein
LSSRSSSSLPSWEEEGAGTEVQGSLVGSVVPEVDQEVLGDSVEDLPAVVVHQEDGEVEVDDLNTLRYISFA